MVADMASLRTHIDHAFRVGEVTVTLEAVARRDAQGGGKIRWWLIEAGGDVKTGKETPQTLVLSHEVACIRAATIAGCLKIMVAAAAAA
jgi:Trypsin-co-occurring domain 2